jgi:hypothetical protein
MTSYDATTQAQASKQLAAELLLSQLDRNTSEEMERTTFNLGSRCSA